MRSLALVPALLFCMIAAVRPALANPIVVSPETSVSTVLAVNFPIDLAMLTLGILLVARLFGWNACALPRDFSRLIWRVLVAAVIVAFIGSLVDSALVYPGVYFDHGPRLTVVRPEPDVTLRDWAAAFLIILGSILLVYLVVVRINVRMVLIPSMAVALASPITWYLTARSIRWDATMTANYTLLFVVAWIVGIAATVIAFIGLSRLHKKACPSV